MAVFDVSCSIMRAQVDNVQTPIHSNPHTAYDPEHIFERVNPGGRL